MNRIKQQFKLLRSFAPDASQKASFRRILQSTVTLDSSALPAQSIFMRIAQSMRTAPACALAIVITLIGSGSGVSFAAQNAIPGETLYKVKLATEQIRIAVTPGKKTKAELHLGFASQRLNEIERLIEQSSGAQAVISETLARYENELDKSEALATHNPELAQNITAIIGETTESHKRTLKRVAEKAHERLFNGNLDDELDNAYEHAESKDDAVLITALSATSTAATPVQSKIVERSRTKWESLKREIERRETDKKENRDDIGGEAAIALEHAGVMINNAATQWETGKYKTSVEQSIKARALVKEVEKIEKEKRKEKERERDERRKERTNEKENEKDD